jgi:DNA polymerase-3 subunit alpha
VENPDETPLRPPDPDTPREDPHPLATRSFTHLHTHTEFSMLDGAARVKDLVQAAASDGQPALGITDHGNMYGVLDFYAACRDAGINPVIGTEAYMAAESRHERPVRKGKVDVGTWPAARSSTTT